MQMKSLSFLIKGLAIAALLFFVGCTKKQDPTNLTSLTPEQLLERGQQAYASNCQSCHGPDPKKDGSIGPAVWGSSLELLTLRVMKAEYPEGYGSKRTTKLMVPLPHLEKDLPALHLYLNK